MAYCIAAYHDHPEDRRALVLAVLLVPLGLCSYLTGIVWPYEEFQLLWLVYGSIVLATSAYLFWNIQWERLAMFAAALASLPFIYILMSVTILIPVLLIIQL